MRRIPRLPILIFFLVMSLTGGSAYLLYLCYHSLLLSGIFFFLINIIFYRILAYAYPVREEGYTEAHSLLGYDVQSMYDILFVAMILTSRLLPFPFVRLLYKVFGLKIGYNSYPGESVIGTPYHFVTVGDNVILGTHSTITPHSYESIGKLTLKQIRIGHNVTIGVNSAILPGVIIEDGAIVAAGAVVTKGTHIGKGEVWAGVPARKIRDGVTVTQP